MILTTKYLIKKMFNNFKNFNNIIWLIFVSTFVYNRYFIKANLLLYASTKN